MSVTTSKSSRPRPRALLFLSISAWVCALAVGIRMLVAYELSPGSAGTVPDVWPTEAGRRPTATRPTLVLFLHPQCPCSRATVAELAQILADAGEKITTLAYIYAPAGDTGSWSDTDLARSILAQPGVRLQPDPDGRIASRFGAETSGQAMLFGENGALLFSGGLTGGRGHEGDNAGRRAVLARINQLEKDFVRTSVFGCSLQNETTPPKAPL